MKTPAGKECRLLKAQGQTWSRDLCKTCVVPEIARANSCQHLQLNVVVARPLAFLFQKRVQVSAFCEKVKRGVDEPQIGCGECHTLPFKFEVKE